MQSVSKEKDVLEEAAYYIIQSLAAQAGAAPEKSAERKKSTAETLTLITAFPKEFPESKSLGEIRLLQARLHIQEGAFAEASQDLDAARTSDKEKELTEDIDYLQAYAEAQRARQLLADFKKNRRGSRPRPGWPDLLSYRRGIESRSRPRSQSADGQSRPRCRSHP